METVSVERSEPRTRVELLLEGIAPREIRQSTARTLAPFVTKNLVPGEKARSMC